MERPDLDLPGSSQSPVESLMGLLRRKLQEGDDLTVTAKLGDVTKRASVNISG